uniref:Uncharacterized protein n=1 Tax=Solanum lycopersicum TaxID=4081 RepID=A0A3Q7FG03_SOLLC
MDKSKGKVEEVSMITATRMRPATQRKNQNRNVNQEKFPRSKFRKAPKVFTPLRESQTQLYERLKAITIHFVTVGTLSSIHLVTVGTLSIIHLVTVGTLSSHPPRYSWNIIEHPPRYSWNIIDHPPRYSWNIIEPFTSLQLEHYRASTSLQLEHYRASTSLQLEHYRVIHLVTFGTLSSHPPCYRWNIIESSASCLSLTSSLDVRCLPCSFRLQLAAPKEVENSRNALLKSDSGSSEPGKLLENYIIGVTESCIPAIYTM